MYVLSLLTEDYALTTLHSVGHASSISRSQQAHAVLVDFNTVSIFFPLTQGHVLTTMHVQIGSAFFDDLPLPTGP